MMRIEDGGEWLRRTRMYLKNNIVGGDRCQWGSEEILHLSVRQIEELAQRAVEGYHETLLAEGRVLPPEGGILLEEDSEIVQRVQELISKQGEER